MNNNRIFPNCKLPDFKVATRCITYNQASFIQDALNGFSIQKTSFPYLVVIIDDASTDGEQNVIEKYMKDEFMLENNSETECWEHDLSRFIYARHPQNRNCYFVVMLLKRNLYREFPKKKALYYPWVKLCNYWAECEGDDYWTNPNKLQMQVDFLESNPEYSMCFHNAIEHYENGEKEDKLFSDIEDKDYTDFDILSHWIVPTASVLYNKDVLDSRIYKIITNEIKPLFGDTPYFIAAAQCGKVRGFSNIMSVYRRQETGAVYNNVFNNPQKRDKILNDYYLIAKAVGPHLMEPIISKYLQYGYEYKQFKYLAKAFMISPLKTTKIAFKGCLFMLSRKTR